jgi:hypothetical protein
MRKMKKFLAVTLSAAMVLSVSVPAMAAGRVASNTEYAMNEKDLQTAYEKYAEAEAAFETAKYELDLAKEALAEAKEEARKDRTPKYSSADVQEAKTDAAANKDTIDGYKAAVATAQVNYGKALKEEQEALTKWQGAKKAYVTAKADYEKAAKAAADAETVAEKAELEKAAAIAKESLAAAEAAAKSARKAYEGTEDLTNLTTPVTPTAESAAGKSITAKRDLDTAKTNLQNAKEVAREDLVYAYKVEAAYKAQQNNKTAIQELEAEVAQCEANAAAAKEALDAAEKELDAASAKLDEAGRRVAADNLYKAQVNEEQKAIEEQRALDALTVAKSEVDAIKAQITQYEQDIKDFDAALIANDDAQDAAADAAADVLDAQAVLVIAERGLELAKKDYDEIPAELAALQDDLNNAIAAKANLVDPVLAEYLAADQAVYDAKLALKEYETYYEGAIGTVLENATAAYNKADREYRNALAAWDAAERAAVQAEANVGTAFAKYQTAIKGLYVVEPIGKYDVRSLYGESAISEKDWFDPTYVPVTPVMAKDATGKEVKVPTEKIYRVGGIFTLIDENYEAKKVDGKVKAETPAKNYSTEDAYDVVRLDTNTYAFLDDFGEVITDWTVSPITTTNTDPRLYFGNKYQDSDRVSQFPVLTAQVTDEDGDINIVRDADGNVIVDDEEFEVIPTGLYSMLEAAQVTVDADGALQDQYDKAVQAHKLAAQELGEAEAEYEFYFGNKEGTPSKAVESIVAGFKDVSIDDWFAPYVADVVDKDIMKGYASTNFTTFGSYDTLQRQDFVMTLWNMAGKPVVNTTTGFKDVEKGSYYEAAVNWAYSEGIVKGYTATEFGVGKNITREDFTVMLYRYNKYSGPKATISGFTDSSKVSGYAVDAVKWAVAAGAISGKTAADGSKYIDPQAPIARCESAKILSIITA